MKPSEREAWAARVAELRAKQPSVLGQAPKSHTPAKKNRLQNAARTTVVDGIRFSSKLESDRYRELKLLQLAGEIAYTLRQVPFVVATGKVYRLDFMIIWNRHGSPAEVITYEDTKGRLTEVSALKIAAVQDRYGIKIKLLTRQEVSR
jgi:Protein of unknown function (DUF1064)